MIRFSSLFLILILSFSVFLPVPVFAACPANVPLPPTTFAETLCLFTSFINSLLPVIVGATLLVFFWGLAKVIRGSGDEKVIEEGKSLMKWGILALFVMVSFIGIINLITGDLFGQPISTIPQFPTTSP